MQKEPAIIIGAFVALVQAILTCVVTLGISLTGEQQGAIIGVAAAVGALVQAWLTRRKVTSPDGVKVAIAEALQVSSGGEHEAAT